MREARRQEDYENDSVPELEHQVFEPGDEMHHPIAGRLRDFLPHPGASIQAGWRVFAYLGILSL